jgi:transcriptional regulator with XRE-family HTH domain
MSLSARSTTQLRPTATTQEILQEIGRRLARYRLQQNRTIAELAHAAGLGTATVKRAEAGRGPTLETIVRLLRALGRIEALDAFLPAPLVSPLQLAELKGRERQRASTPRRRGGNAGSGDQRDG